MIIILENGISWKDILKFPSKNLMKPTIGWCLLTMSHIAVNHCQPWGQECKGPMRERRGRRGAGECWVLGVGKCRE